jgi:hypothetical protein
MNTSLTQRSHLPGALLLVGSLLVGASAIAATSEELARYQQERAVCTSGQSNQDRATCLREAGAAFAEAKQHGLDDSSAQQAQNATKRCDRLPDPDRRDCIARMQGQGTTSGSVAGGGVYRELVTREPGPQSPAQPAGDSPPVPSK